ncbi:bifunctional pyr operon transcriptional regulator/uracil phosphoribosyltransferase PyrR [Natronogracilivirga saccharolytica]|uniref:Bifunctional protein PyrR n=1 Tax=Natronogracilivirga saccharolytica TaxID=2812953 RepID=A0A8J7UUF5_9BACT|nr:bifunctional pyr operon transcriptional regulator/uracil phosphoribosyltransferase PyrR [Natronogracilivirga saccharolytica]MBP3193581.1 bifunctional pyr operon transcriptional regulator/uracil phosphoribosyltransferase PyrR [Natronogracilivirga saccharolytica]
MAQLLLSSEDLDRTCQRLAHQFVEPFDDPGSLAIIGMQTRGVDIARRINGYIKQFFSVDVPMGVLDTTFYRDDFRTRMKMPSVQVTDIPFDLFGRDLVLVDDVLYTGRTVRSAMDALMSFGRPSSVRFCCMVDRGHRELPVTADYVGIYVPTHLNEEIRVETNEQDGREAVFVVRKKEEPEA